MNMFARFDENPAMTLRVIKETKRYGRTDNVKTVYPLQTKFAPPTNKVCWGYNNSRTLVKSGNKKFNFLISQPKHMLWVLKRTVSMRRFF